MFRWYKNATACYVYLSDVAWCSSKAIMEERFSKSRWFTRGWTLQELIAPRRVQFYTTDWQIIGRKTGVCGFISIVAGIGAHILMGWRP